MIDTLSHYHPLVIEGMGAYDTRKPASVAAVIVRQLQTHWLENPAPKPVLLITQGDPYEPSGISAITRIVADQLDLSRALIFLDPEIADYHAPNADRYKVIFELSYSTMVNTLRTAQPCVVKTIEATVDDHLAAKNARRSMLGKTSLPAYYRTFALLQEVTKISCKQVCSGVTVAHTSPSRSISDFSVSSFYRVGLELGLIDPSEMVPYAD